MTNEEFNRHTDEAINMANSARLKNLRENSLAEYGAKAEKVEQKRENIKKNEYRNHMIAFLIVATIAIGYLGVRLVDWISRENDIKEADQFMDQKIVSIYEEGKVAYTLSDGKVILMEEDYAQVIELSKIFEEKGFDSHEFLYAVYKTGGIESLDRAVKGLGYRDVHHFLYERYRDPDTGQGSLNRFLNNNEVGYVESVNDLKELEASKGMGL